VEKAYAKVMPDFMEQLMSRNVIHALEANSAQTTSKCLMSILQDSKLLKAISPLSKSLMNSNLQ
jgi:hypothetical protein